MPLGGLSLNPYQYIRHGSDRGYIFTGQSNNQGYANVAELPSELSGVLSNAFIWNGSAFVPLQAGVTNLGFAAATSPGPGYDSFGPEMKFAERMLANDPRPIYIVKQSKGAPLHATAGDDWSPGSPGELFDQLIVKCNAALVAVPNIQWRSVNLMQGESDGLDPTFTANRKVNLQAFKRAFELQIGVGVMFSGTIRSTTGMAAINAALDAAAAEDRLLRKIDTSSFSLLPDNVHFDTAGQIALGAAFAAANIAMNRV